MHARDLLPWNWHRREVAVERVERRPLSRLQDEINRVFEGFGDPWRGFGASGPEAFLPALEVSNDPDEVAIRVEMPGIDEKDVHISVDEDLLTIRGEKRAEHEETRHGVRWSECQYGAFERGIPLPPGLDLDAIEAKVKRGVLQIRVPKRAEARERRREIPVDAG